MRAPVDRTCVNAAEAQPRTRPERIRDALRRCLEGTRFHLDGAAARVERRFPSHRGSRSDAVVIRLEGQRASDRPPLQVMSVGMLEARIGACRLHVDPGRAVDVVAQPGQEAAACVAPGGTAARMQVLASRRSGRRRGPSRHTQERRPRPAVRVAVGDYE